MQDSLEEILISSLVACPYTFSSKEHITTRENILEIGSALEKGCKH